MAENTGYKAYARLLKVTDDGTQRPLDVNNNLCSESGLPQDFKDNNPSDPNYVAPVLDETACPIPNPDNYCVNWIAENQGNIKMMTSGYIDFTDVLGAKNIHTGASVGTITGYIVVGVSGIIPCSVPMTFTSKRAQWNVDTLPVVADKVLTSLIYTVVVTCTDGTDLEPIEDGQTNAVVTPGQMTSSYNSCT